MQEERLEGDIARELRFGWRLWHKHRRGVSFEVFQSTLHFAERIPRVKSDILRRQVFFAGVHFESQLENLVHQVAQIFGYTLGSLWSAFILSTLTKRLDLHSYKIRPTFKSYLVFSTTGNLLVRGSRISDVVIGAGDSPFDSSGAGSWLFDWTSKLW